MDPTKTLYSLFAHGSVGDNLVFGNNQWGPWVSTNKWTKEQWEGKDGVNVDNLLILVDLWNSMSSIERTSWASRAKRAMLSTYTFFVMFNIRRLFINLPPLSSYP
jgi:hypothetical protein